MMRRVGCLLAAFMVALACAHFVPQAEAAEAVRKIRITWDIVPDAVMYQLVVMRGNSKRAEDVLVKKQDIYPAGYELDASLLPLAQGNLYWKVQALDINRRPIADFTAPKPLIKAEINPGEPLPTTQFDRLPYAKIYPVYSWIPVAKAQGYELQVFRGTGNRLAADGFLLKTDHIDGQTSFNYYDDDAYVSAGVYWWRIRAKNALKFPIGTWSAPQYFRVECGGVQIAALGDSITHGGGAVSTPPSYTMYDWETYTGLPILNLGFSGDTVEGMVERFNRDVLSFSPRVLVIMGGVNNIRLGDSADMIVSALNRLKYKCLFNKIIPVFVTVTPINPAAMQSVSNITAAPGWRREQEKVNKWIKEQPYHVDITPQLTDVNGRLKAALSVDGLHPDVDGKRIIGSAIGTYLKEEFKEFSTGKK